MENKNGKWCVVRHGVWLISKHETEEEALEELDEAMMRCEFPSQQNRLVVEFLEDAEV